MIIRYTAKGHLILQTEMKERLQILTKQKMSTSPSTHHTQQAPEHKARHKIQSYQPTRPYQTLGEHQDYIVSGVVSERENKIRYHNISASIHLLRSITTFPMMSLISTFFFGT